MRLSDQRCLVFLAWAGMTLLQVRADDAPVSLTPPSPPTPLIHGAKVFGSRPGAPFLFTIAATGDRPMAFSADHLPAGISLDPQTGRMTGTTPAAGDYAVTLRAKNALGETQRGLLIKSGPTLALTPPMGWNSWNCFASAVSDAKIRAAADAMISSGLVNHGWTYINIDDYWQVNPKSNDPTLHGPERDAAGNILPNSRFPDMKALADYIHAHGLKAGLYSSPGPYTCGGCTGSYQHEEQDAQQYGAWGFDYLKYDLCTYREIYKKEDGVEGMKKPYAVMQAALSKVNRDIVYSFCQYGMGDVWKWGAETGGNSWRTTGDIRDNWESMMANAQKQANLPPYAGPGHWNDPDMLVVGQVGWGPSLHATHLTPDEQYTHISLWCLQVAPLLIGCDLTQLDPFTLGLLTNDEVIDIDQDPLGKAGRIIQFMDRGGLLHTDSEAHPYENDLTEIWAKEMEDGSLAIGFFNLCDKAMPCKIIWSELGLNGPQSVRDVWRQKDLGTFDQKFERGPIPPHGVLLLRLRKP